jgi:N4-gp56 family major capsid protein
MITSAQATGGVYSPLTPAVRDVYSKEVFFLAQPRLRFLQFTKVRRDLQQGLRGRSIIFTKYNNLTGGGQLAETDVLVPQALSAQEVQIWVYEQGNATQVDELLLNTSFLNIMEDASISLANNFAKVLDGQLRDALYTTTNVIFGNNATSAQAMTSSSVLNAATIRAGVEVLATADTPKIGGDYYVCFIHPHQKSQITADSEWQEAHKYMGRRNLYLGEVGMYEGVIFIETTQMTKLTAAQVNTLYGSTTFANAGAYGYQAVMFGENTVAWGICMDVELRDDGVTDFGRTHAIAWYGIWGTGLLEQSYAVRILTV